MSAQQFIQKPMVQAALRWRLGVFKALNGTTIVGLGSLVAALSNQNWSDMDGQGRFLLCAGVGLSVLKSLDMLLDHTIGDLRAGQATPDEPAALPGNQAGETKTP